MKRIMYLLFLIVFISAVILIDTPSFGKTKSEAGLVKEFFKTQRSRGSCIPDASLKEAQYCYKLDKKNHVVGLYLYDLVGDINLNKFTNLKTLSIDNDRIPENYAGSDYGDNASNIHGGRMTSLNISKCKKLTNISLTGVALKKVDTTKNSKLKSLIIKKGSINSMKIGGKTTLTEADLQDTYVGNGLSLKGYEKLKTVRAMNGYVPSIDVSGAKKLKFLFCDNTSLKTLKIKNCTTLDQIECQMNRLQSLDASTCTKLQILYCYDNKLSSLKVAGAKKLRVLLAQNNSFSKLNIKNTSLKNTTIGDPMHELSIDSGVTVTK